MKRSVQETKENKLTIMETKQRDTPKLPTKLSTINKQNVYHLKPTIMKTKQNIIQRYLVSCQQSTCQMFIIQMEDLNDHVATNFVPNII